MRERPYATDRSYGFVHRLLQESGVVLRSRGGARPGRRAKKSAAA
ncbi:helix-turn-helix domain-containing protein [Microbispora sp. GKU 823]